MDLLPIQNKIYEIRGYRIMLDFDLAFQYGIETRVLKQAVRRNLKRFEGDDFMFEVTKDELSRSHFVTLNKSRGMNIKYNPFAFTELGVAMLSSVLNSDTAIEVNRNIMRAFVAVRQLLQNPVIHEIKELQNDVNQLRQYVDDILTDQNDINQETRMELVLLQESMAELQVKNKPNKPRNPIGFTSPHYDPQKKD